MNDFGPRGYHVFDCVVKKQASGLVAACETLSLPL
jgi:hypothetical protein